MPNRWTITAQEASDWHQLGTCAVVDNNNPENPVINVGPLGETQPDLSSGCFYSRAKAYPVLTTAKHFPGHGDTATDSHLDLCPTHQPWLRLVAPFKAAIAAGVDAVMSAHLLIPSWDAEQPATLSERILTSSCAKVWVLRLDCHG